jgi:hypothetical protein
MARASKFSAKVSGIENQMSRIPTSGELTQQIKETFIETQRRIAALQDEFATGLDEIKSSTSELVQEDFFQQEEIKKVKSMAQEVMDKCRAIEENYFN